MTYCLYEFIYEYFMKKILLSIYNTHLSGRFYLDSGIHTTYFSNTFCLIWLHDCELGSLLLEFQKLHNHTYVFFEDLSRFSRLILLA